MASQTITDAARNHDDSAVSGLLDGEAYTLNNGTLTINGDVRWGFNGAVVGNITVSATLGGEVITDGRDVWEVPFSASSGNVPTVNAAGSNAISGAGVAGELLRVWAWGVLTPAAAGGAMPASGWVKLRSKTGDFSNGLVVTLPGGATITCSGAGKRSWIHVVAAEATTMTLPRLGKWTCRGDWYELGETNGADGQTFQYPVADACPAIQIETAPGSGVYEWWPNAGDRWGTTLVYVPDDVRGKFFGMSNATGVITIARRSSNACGYKPAAGCKVRVPNVLLSSSTSANWASNTVSTTLATRYDLTTTGGGEVDVEFACGGWYLTATNAFRFGLRRFAMLHAIVLSNIADTTILEDGAVGLNSIMDATPLLVTNCFTSIDLTGLKLARYQSNVPQNVGISLADVANYTETDCTTHVFGTSTYVTRASASSYSRRLQRLVGVNRLIRPVAIGAQINVTTCANVKMTDVRYADQPAGVTGTLNPLTAIVITTGCTNIELDGFSAFGGLPNVHPYTGIVSVAASSQSIKVANIGTAAAPYDCGSVDQVGVGITAAVTVGLEMRRIYLQGTRTAPLSIANTVQGVVCDNVWGDGADSQALAGVNLTARGCRWTNSTTGQSAVYGRHWEDAFTSPTAGRLLIACNEPLAATVDQCQIVAGTPAFTSAGQIAMRAAGDEVIWTMPYFLLGVTSFANSTPTVTGTGATFVSGDNWTNFYLDFQWDTGAGWNGSWLGLNGAALSGIGAINPATGVRLKVRARTKTAASTNALTYLRINTTTDTTSQQQQYPLPRAQLTVTGCEPGSDIVIYDASVDATGDGTNVLVTGDAVSGPFIFDYDGTPQIRIGVFKPGFVPQITPTLNLTTTDSTYPIQQRADRNYA